MVMKLKRILCMLMATMLLSVTAVCTVAAEGTEEMSPDSATAVEVVVKRVAPENAIESLGLENPCEVDENGNVALEEGKLIDLILPKLLNGQEQTSISAKSFAGCPYIRSVVIPETILEIGEGAFADCEFLKTVYVIGHSEEDMTLGANWNGGAEVVYVYDEIQVEEETPAAEEQKVEEQEEADKKDAAEPEQAPDAETVKEPESSDPAKESTEGKAPAEEKDSGEQKESQEESDAEQQEDSKDAASSNEADKASPQGETEESAEGSGDVPVSAEVSEGAEA